MKTSIKLQIRSSEIRQRLNELAAAEELGDDERGELGKLTAELSDVEQRLRAALAAEPAAEETTVPAEDGEAAELRKLTAAASIGEVVAAVLDGRKPGGATAELQAHVGVKEHQVPMALFAASSVTTPSGEQTEQQPTELAVMPTRLAELAGVRRVPVMAGEQTFPTVTAPVSGVAPVAAAATVADTTVTIAATALSPARLQASATFGVEQAAIFGSGRLDMDIEAVLRDVISDSLDRQCLVGSGGLFAVGTDDDDAAATTFAGYISHVAGAVDGRYADMMSDVAVITGSEIFADMASTYQTTPLYSAADVIGEKTAGLHVSVHAPAVASNVGQVLLARSRDRRNAVQPVWGGPMLIRDIYSAAAEGEVKISIVQLAAFGIQRAAAFDRFGANTSS